MGVGALSELEFLADQGCHYAVVQFVIMGMVFGHQIAGFEFLAYFHPYLFLEFVLQAETFEFFKQLILKLVMIHLNIIRLKLCDNL